MKILKALNFFYLYTYYLTKDLNGQPEKVSTFLLHKSSGQALASYQDWERISAIISFMNFTHLHCVICQVVMDNKSPAFTKHVPSVIPNGIKTKNLKEM